MVSTQLTDEQSCVVAVPKPSTAELTLRNATRIQVSDVVYIKPWFRGWFLDVCTNMYQPIHHVWYRNGWFVGFATSPLLCQSLPNPGTERKPLPNAQGLATEPPESSYEA